MNSSRLVNFRAPHPLRWRCSSGLSLGLPAAFLHVRGTSRTLYDVAEGSGWDQAELVEQVRQLSESMTAASQGDLTAQVHIIVTEDGDGEFGFQRTQHIAVLSQSFDHTVGVVAGFGVSGACGWGADWCCCFSGVGGCS